MKWWWVLSVTAMVVGCSDAKRPSGNANEQAAPAMDRPAVIDRQRSSANIFYSGHSLMDRPLPDFVQQVAESRGARTQWNRQYAVGSSIRQRTQGVDPSVPGWPGYKAGYNRDGEGLDVVAELRAPKTIEGSYDVLVITEEHTLPEKLLKTDTVRLLRHYHDRLIEGNASATTYFYEPWFAVETKSDPRSWIAYERTASPIWQCMVTRVNASLELEGRSDRVISLPAGAALAELIERATRKPGLPAITQSTVAATVDSFFSDQVHLRPLGAYYLSLVTYASVYRHSPQGAWHPEEVTATQAATLQLVAWDFVSRYYDSYQPLSLPQCKQRLLSDRGLQPLWLYIRQTLWNQELGRLRSYVRYFRRLSASRALLEKSDATNPFHFDAGVDSQFWDKSEP